MQLSGVEAYISSQFKLAAEHGAIFVVLTASGYFIQPQAGIRVLTLASAQKFVNNMSGQIVTVALRERRKRLIAATGTATVAISHAHAYLLQAVMPDPDPDFQSRLLCFVPAAIVLRQQPCQCHEFGIKPTRLVVNEGSLKHPIA